MSNNFNDILIEYIQSHYNTNDFIPLHAPVFSGNEKKNVASTIDTTFVSTIGEFVNQFEVELANYTSARKATAVTNGTSALHAALLTSGVGKGDLVITQPLSFIATCNAINYCGAAPVFLDVDLDTMGLSPMAVENFLEENAFIDYKGCCRLLKSKQRIKACVPMHTFGHPMKIDELVELCAIWKIDVIEDAAESLGSFYKNKHTGTFGLMGALSFNGNKIITTGGGGSVLSSNNNAIKLKHITTTAKVADRIDFYHDMIGYNYRMPNLNAALGCAQLERLTEKILCKRNLAHGYANVTKGSELQFFSEPKNCRSNYWLNAVICENSQKKNELLNATNKKGIMARPVWTLMHKLPMFEDCIKGNLKNAEWLEERLVNLPSSALV